VNGLSEHKKILSGIGAAVFRNASTTVSNNTATAIAFNSQRYDTAGMHSTTVNPERITIKSAGIYSIAAHIVFAANSTGRRQLQIKLNATTIIALSEHAQTVGQIDSYSTSTIYKLAVDDYLEVYAYHLAGGDLAVTSSTNYSPEFRVHKIGD